MNLPTSVCVNADVVSQRLGEEAILLNLKTGVYWGLNRTGTDIWQEIESHGEVQRILATFRRRYDASVVGPVRELLIRLLEEGLLVVNGSDS